MLVLGRGSERYLETLRPYGRTKSFHKKEIITYRASRAEAYALTKGVARIVLSSANGRVHTLAYVKPGCMIGHAALSLHQQEEQLIEVQGVLDGEALFLTKTALEDAIGKHPELVTYLLQCSALMIQSLLSQMEIALYGDAILQVAAVLLQLSADYQESRDGCVRISQDELSWLIGRSRVTVTGALQKLENLGAVRSRGHRRIFVSAPDVLLQIVANESARSRSKLHSDVSQAGDLVEAPPLCGRL